MTDHTRADDLGSLAKLAAEVDGGDYLARVVTPHGRRPYLDVRNRHADLLTERIYAGDGSFWFGWAERIAPLGEVGKAAEIVMRVLRAVDNDPSSARDGQ